MGGQRKMAVFILPDRFVEPFISCTGCELILEICQFLDWTRNLMSRGNGYDVD